jgi:hypothetical protein
MKETKRKDTTLSVCSFMGMFPNEGSARTFIENQLWGNSMFFPIVKV